MFARVFETGPTRDRECVLLTTVLCSAGIGIRISEVGIVLIVDTSIYNLFTE